MPALFLKIPFIQLLILHGNKNYGFDVENLRQDTK